MKDDKLIINENGIEKEYDILFAFKDEGENANYVVFTDFEIKENGKIKIYSNRYEISNKGIKLFTITNEEIKRFIEEKLEEIRNECIDDEE